jgi:hypothetical protein
MWPTRLKRVFDTTLLEHSSGGGSVIDLEYELEAHRSLGCCRPGRGDSATRPFLNISGVCRTCPTDDDGRIGREGSSSEAETNP